MGKRINAIKAWAKENPGEAIGAATAIFGAVGYGLKIATDYSKRSQIYDRSNGFYINTKHLTTADKVEIDRRHSHGETLTHIIGDMGKLR